MPNAYQGHSLFRKKALTNKKTYTSPSTTLEATHLILIKARRFHVQKERAQSHGTTSPKEQAQSHDVTVKKTLLDRTVQE